MGHDGEDKGSDFPESLAAATDILNRGWSSPGKPIATAGSSGDKPLKIERYHTLVASYIFGILEPEWSDQFEKRNAEYGEYDAELGTLGEMVEIHRKYKKLKRAFIEKADTSDWAESPRQVAMDMIGHLYLLIAVIDEEADDGR
jgi:hypothetical protein